MNGKIEIAKKIDQSHLVGTGQWVEKNELTKL